MKVEGNEAIEIVNDFVRHTNSTCFMIRDYDGSRLEVVGSFDHCYYHEIEVIFNEVSYMSLPTQFDCSLLRVATREEIEAIERKTEIEGTVYCIAEDPTSEDKMHWIVAESVKAEKCMVFYYEREKIKPGERIELSKKIAWNQTLVTVQTSLRRDSSVSSKND